MRGLLRARERLSKSARVALFASVAVGSKCISKVRNLIAIVYSLRGQLLWHQNYVFGETALA